MKLIRLRYPPLTQYIYSRGDGEGDLLVWLASLVRPFWFLARFTSYLSFCENRWKKYQIVPKWQPSKVESFCMGGPYVIAMVGLIS